MKPTMVFAPYNLFFIDIKICFHLANEIELKF